MCTVKPRLTGLQYNYGHDDFSIGLLRDTTPHVDCYDDLWSAKPPFLVESRALLLPATATTKDAVRSIKYHNIMPEKEFMNFQGRFLMPTKHYFIDFYHKRIIPYLHD